MKYCIDCKFRTVIYHKIRHNYHFCNHPELSIIRTHPITVIDYKYISCEKANPACDCKFHRQIKRRWWEFWKPLLVSNNDWSYKQSISS